MSERKPKLTFCRNCKKDTQTIISRDPGLFGSWPFNAKDRICKECGKQKRKSSVEMEESEDE